MSGYQILTVKNEDGCLAIRRKAPDELIAGSRAAAGIENTVSGPAAAFTDGSGGKAAVGLTVDIVPGVGGRGTVGPTNPRPLTGHTSAVIRRSGKNLFDKTDYTQLMISCTAASGSTSATVAGVGYKAAWVKLPGGVTYAVSCPTHSSTAFRVIATSEFPVATNAYRSPVLYTVNNASATSLLFQAPAETQWIGFALYTTSSTDVTSIGEAVAGLQVEIADAPTAAEPYGGTKLELTLPAGAGTVYAGTLDVTAGRLTVTHAYKQFDGTEAWNQTGTNPYFSTPIPSAPMNTSHGWCSHFPWAVIRSGNTNIGADALNGTSGFALFRPGSGVASTAAEWASWLAEQAAAGTPVQMVYPLYRPVEHTLTAEELTMLPGVNRIWSECGDVTLTYIADTKKYVDDRIAALTALILENVGS